MNKPSYLLKDIAQLVNGQLSSHEQDEVHGVASLKAAQSEKGQISFFRDTKFKSDLLQTKALAVVINAEHAALSPVPTIIVENPQQAFAQIAELFVFKPNWIAGIHPTAIVDQTAKIDASAYIGPYAVVGPHVKIDAHTFIGPHCVINEGTTIGKHCYLHSHVVLYHYIEINDHVHIDSGAVIGADGFGLYRTKSGWKKIPQVGSVHIKQDVWIGAHCTIDRGALEHTVLAQGVKLDDQVHVGHGTKINAHTVIAGQTGIAGSTEIGEFCMLGGGCRISDHLKIPEQTVLTGNTFLTRNLKESGIYSSGTVAHENHLWRKNTAIFNQLNEYIQRLKQLEKQFKQINQGVVAIHDESN